MKRGLTGAVSALLLPPLLAGCAATAPPPASPAARAPGETTHPAATKSVAPAQRASVVPADSLPSEDALSVLKTIPEPLAPGDVVPPPESGAPPHAADTTGVQADTASVVPTPSLTAPLGEGPGSSAQSSLADSLARAAAALAPAPKSAGASAAGASATRAGAALAGAGAGAMMVGGAGGATGGAALMHALAANDTCWRVQVAAPLDSSEAETMRAAAESQLLVPMVISVENYRYKVQCRDCLTELSSMALRMRALAAGFDGAFRTRTIEEPSAPAQSAPTPPSARPSTPGAKKPAPKSTPAGKSDSP